MAVIVPTITTDNQTVFDTNLAEFSKFAKRVHIDFSDGTLAPTKMLPLDAMHGVEGVALDIHIMSVRPSDYLADIVKLKPSLCIVHAEVEDDIESFFAQLKNAGIKTGISLLKKTFPKSVQARIVLADHVMIFAGQLGVQGGTIDMLQTEKIPLVKALKPDLEIGWDGGVNLSNVRALAHSGADVINVGSAITNAEDKAAMYQALVVESERKGVLI